MPAGVKPGGTRSNEIEILESNDNNCTFSFSPNKFELDTVRTVGKDYVSIYFDGSAPYGKPGDPNIPCRIVSLGVPPEGNVRLSVLEAKFQRAITGRLVPFSDLKKEGGMVSNVYREGESYLRPGMAPIQFSVVEKPEWSGDLRIVRIFVFPVRFDPSINSVEIYSKITVRVEFESGSTVQVRQAEQENAFFRKAILNYPVAGKWQTGRISNVAGMQKTQLSGQWYKIPVSQEGVYKVTGSFLKSFGVNLSSIQANTVKICNNGGRALPQNLTEARPDSLIENPILVSGLDDGRFDEADYFLFYGRGVAGWEYSAGERQWSHYTSLFDTANVYWLGFNDNIAGKRIPGVSVSAVLPETLNRFTDRFFFEQDIYNPFESGNIWLGYEFNALSGLSNRYTQTVQLPGLVENDSLRIRIRFSNGKVNSTNQFYVQFNETALPLKQFYYEQFFLSNDLLIGKGKTGANTISFSYASTTEGTNAYLDWFEIEYLRLLKATNGILHFYSPLSSGANIYPLTDFSSEPLILDVTRYSAIRKMNVRQEGGQWVFTDTVSSNHPKQYYAVQESAYRTPGSIQADGTSDLKNSNNRADLIIIAHRDFMDQARRLKSFRETQDSLSVFLADIQDVYDEFSCGQFDPVAIRDFVRHAFDHWAQKPSYLLLFGDGDYDYRNILSKKDKNWIPPFETDDNLTRATDDWYTYVSGNDSQMDLAVGRIPVQTAEEAGIIVDKLIQYQNDPDRGDWRTLVTIVGDDEKSQNGDADNEIGHIIASESVAEYIISPEFNLKKIYLTDFPDVLQAEGRRKPKAKESLLDQINRGTLLVNFIGHGNEDVWTHEQIFNHELDLPALRNGSRLPLFYAATCTFAWYDNPEKQSFSEDLLTTEGKGAIAVIAASRECYAPPNEALNAVFIREIFSASRSNLRIGDALRLGKQNTYNVSNNEKYHILGDPTLRLAVPSMKSSFTEMTPDSFQALSLTTVRGKINQNGSTQPPFQGKVLLKGFDSKKTVTYITKLKSTLVYQHPGNALFRGEAEVKNGLYEISFFVPKEITYGSQTGRLSAYLWNESEDGFGAMDSIRVGGTSNILDEQGPEIRMAFSDQEFFVSGGMIHEDPELLVILQDNQTGINLTGEIGHNINLSLDNQTEKNVTEYFQYNEGSFVQGTLRYPLIGLSEGEHEVTLKAWDNANNSSIQTILFRIVPAEDLRLEEVMNYPNPFSNTTQFTFQLSQTAVVEIRIYTVEGRMIRKLTGWIGTPGFNIVPWDGLDDVGDQIANGVYLYKVIAKVTLADRTVEKSEISRMLIMR